MSIIKTLVLTALLSTNVLLCSAQEVTTYFNGGKRIYSDDETAALYSVRLTENYTFVTIELIPTRNRSRMSYFTSGFTYVQSGPYKLRFLGSLSSDGQSYHSCEPDDNWGWSNVKKGQKYYYTLVFEGRPAYGLTDFSLIDKYPEYHGYSFMNYTIKNPDPVEKTGLSELSIRQMAEKANDGICGIYEGINNGYRLGCISSGNGYKLVYLGHSSNWTWWHPGDLKGNISPTSDPGIYSGYWYSATKQRFNESYVAFNGYEMRTLVDGDEGAFKKVFPDPSAIGNKWTGSGFALNDGYIVTNFHVVDGANSIVVERVIDSNHEQYTATVVTVDKTNDLAIIKIDPSNNKVKWSIPYTIKYTSSKVGESCFALGFPMTSTMGDEIKLTNGIISSLSGFQGDVSTYQISVPIQPGNSGGPLFNQKGEIIGIVNAKHKGAENVSYAIKSSYLNNLVESFASSKLFPSNNQVSSKSLPDQVAMIKPYVFYIKCEH